MIGTITEFEPQDSLGWIVLDDGRRIRFGGTACRGMQPEVGLRVEVSDLVPGYGGTLKATLVNAANFVEGVDLVWPAPTSDVKIMPDGKHRLRAFDLEGFARESAWALPSVMRKRACPASDLTRFVHPAPSTLGQVLDHWRVSILEGWAPSYQLAKATTGTSKLGGGSARLSKPWPNCTLCDVPFDVVFDVTLADIDLLTLGAGNIVLFACFTCIANGEWEGIKLGGKGGLFVHEANPATLVERCHPSGSGKASRAIGFMPRRSYPSLENELANNVLQKMHKITFEREPAGDYTSALEVNRWKTQIGGFPDWIHGDQTPTCGVCREPMWLLATVGDEAGFEFADCGSAHVFFCARTSSCPGLTEGYGYVEG